MSPKAAGKWYKIPCPACLKGVCVRVCVSACVKQGDSLSKSCGLSMVFSGLLLVTWCLLIIHWAVGPLVECLSASLGDCSIPLPRMLPHSSCNRSVFRYSFTVLYLTLSFPVSSHPMVWISILNTALNTIFIQGTEKILFTTSHVSMACSVVLTPYSPLHIPHQTSHNLHTITTKSTDL